MPTSTSVRKAIADFIRLNFVEGNSASYKSVIAEDNVIEGYSGLSHVLLPSLSAYPRIFLVMEDSDYTPGVSRKQDKKQLITLISQFQVAATEDPSQSLELLEQQVNDYIEDIERMFVMNPTIGGCQYVALKNQEDDLGASNTTATVVMQVEALFTLRY